MTGSLGEVLREALARKWAEDDTAHKQMEEAKPTGKQLFAVSNNVSRATFDYIKANPGARSGIVAALAQQGYKTNSVTSLITQMLRQGVLVIGAGNVLRTAQAEYVPIKSTRKRKEKETMPKRPVSLPPAAGIAAIAPTPVPIPVPVVVTNEVEHILNTLPIKQARALYDELSKIFGDAK